jgi:thymidylate kinase
VSSIILEGYDGGGKSTLAAVLKRELGLDVHLAGPPARDDAHALECISNQNESLKSGVILDRYTPISRLCYQQGLSAAHKRLLNHELQSAVKSAVIIWVKPTEYIHSVSPHDTAEHLLDIENRRDDILRNYQELFSRTKHIEYNHMVNDVDNLVKLLKMHLRS